MSTVTAVRHLFSPHDSPSRDLPPVSPLSKASFTMSTRGGGRQSMSELKLRRLLEHNQRLREDLARPRVKVSEASARYASETAFPPFPLRSPLTAFFQSHRLLQKYQGSPGTLPLLIDVALSLIVCWNSQGTVSMGTGGTRRRSIRPTNDRKMLLNPVIVLLALSGVSFSHT